ncbi:MAG: HAD family hydrolase [Dialister sp.]|nr:HAD family hydrolase [Dialister sp.]
MAPIEMIAIDLDDTLLRDDISVSDYTKRVLQAAMDKGIKIVIATGRMFQSARHWGEALGLSDVPVICYTGAMTGLCGSGKIMSDVRIPLPLAKNILQTIREHGWYGQAYIDDELYVPFRDERTDAYEKQCGVKAHVSGDGFWTLEAAPTKLLVCEYPPVMNEVAAVLRKAYGSLVNQVMSEPYFFEMNHIGCSKGKAIKKLAAMWRIPTDHIMTFGNGNNDISMFRLTPWSYAVANATDEAKREARYETGSNNEDGVASCIAKVVLGE